MGDQSEGDSSSWKTWALRIIVNLSFLLAMASSMNSPSLHSVNGTVRWKAQFFYASPNHESSIEANDDNATHSPYEHEFLELGKVLRHYREASQSVLTQLSLSHEVALRTEYQLMTVFQNDGSNKSPAALSTQIERKISKVAELLEQNALVLEGILKPFPVTIGLSRFSNVELSPLTPDVKSASLDDPDSFLGFSETLPPLARYIPPYNPSKQGSTYFGSEELPYEDAAQIIAHITRDWTVDGTSIRMMTHNWIVDQLWKHHKQLVGSTCKLSQRSIYSPVLVAGAGMGRLAYNIAFTYEEIYAQSEISENYTKQHYFPFEVEAVDSSIVMASAAHHILNDDTEQYKVYPFVNDPFVNEVDTEKRWQPMHFPEKKVISSLKHWKHEPQQYETIINEPFLAYTIGDFVTTYASTAKKGIYGSIATCYFIDTATNIYEYIITIKNLLRHGGLWTNLGPVQWHRNAQLQPSVDELRQMIELFGFRIHVWEVEDRLVAYRHPDDVESSSRFTRSEGYRPLKFVATYEGTDDGADLLLLLEKLRLTTGRKSMMRRAVEKDE